MVFEKVRELLAEYKAVDKETITMETTLEELQLDSLDVVQIIMDLEGEFNITMDTETPAKTVKELVDMIESKM